MKVDKRIVVIYIITIGIILFGVTYALTSPDIGLNVTTADIGIDETSYGSTSFSNSDLKLYPILDSDVDDLISGTSTKVANNVIKIDFNVRGKSDNPTDIKIIYDIALNNLVVDSDLLSRYVKWRLYKNNTLISDGSLSTEFDTINNGRLVLTNIQEDLPAYTSTADSYKFIMWLSDSCQESDITKCIDTENQDYLHNKSISGKVEVELYTGSKKNLERTPNTTSTTE